MVDIKSLTREELTDYITGIGEKKFRAEQLFTWMHKNLAESVDEMTNLPGSLREKLKNDTDHPVLKAEEVQISKTDGTRKYLFSLKDGNLIESVWMRYDEWDSVCISSQAGCNMGCRFCASTIGGCVRSLSASEMLEQVYAIQRASDRRISHVVIMGSGEPLDNFDNLIRFLSIISDEKGLNLSERHITVSTCGLVPEIKRLAGYKKQINLAVSLHAPNDEIRKSLMPVALRYSLNELMEAVKNYFDETGRRITFEYALINGVNDSMENAEELSELIKDINCHVNLIPVNPVKERGFKETKEAKAALFKSKLEKNRINVTIRREMGRDIDGACGQLRRKHLEAGSNV